MIPRRFFARIAEPDVKERLKDQTDLAQESGIFGAPSFMVGEELFWGNDRLEQALELARRGERQKHHVTDQIDKGSVAILAAIVSFYLLGDRT